MLQTVFYNKYRPKTFEQIIGQEVVVKILTAALQKNRVSHSYLFVGPKGTGKTSVARILAHSINCTGDNKPCLKCDNCNNSSDLIELDAASHRGVDEIEKVINDCHFVPTFGNKKVYVLDEVHTLSSTAFNALLKTLEEPPAHVIFILCTTEYFKLPETIRSRCIHLTFRKFNNIEISKYLEYVCQQEHITYTKDALEILAERSNSSIRDSLNLLESFQDDISYKRICEEFHIVDDKLLVQFAYTFITKKEVSCLTIFNKFVYNGGDSKALFRDMIEFLRIVNLCFIDEKGELAPLLTTDRRYKLANSLAKRIEDPSLIKEAIIHLSDIKLKDSDLSSINIEVGIVEHCIITKV